MPDSTHIFYPNFIFKFYRIASEQQNNAQAMFNLGYMHELGHGMPKDIHLAKRFYDMAAETSTDAKVPVAIALAKLGIGFALSNWPYTLQSFKITISPEIYAKFELYWDIYLLTVLVGLLGLVLLVRRPRVQQPPAGNGVARENPQPTVAAPVTPRRETEGAEASNSESTNNDSKSDKNVTSDPASRNATEEQRPP